eukprot:gene11681-24464_t
MTCDNFQDIVSLEKLSGKSNQSKLMSIKRFLIEAAEARFLESKSRGYIAPISPSPNDLITTVVNEMDLCCTDLVVDLGCGDGRWLSAFASRFHCVCIGVDIDSDRLCIARTNSIKERSLHIELIQSDIFAFDLKHMSVVVFYLFRDASSRMIQKIQNECSQQTVLIVVGFQLPGWQPEKTYRSACGVPAYIYRTT